MALASSASAAATVAAEALQAEIEGEDLDFVPIEKLQAAGINVADINKLRESGIYSVGMLAKTTSRALTAIKGFSDAKVAKIRDATRKLDDKPVFKNGVEALHSIQHIMRITTGCKELDTALGGGVETGSITEIHGEYRTGKSQLCHTLAVTTQLAPDAGGAAGRVIIVDTEGSIRPDRIGQIAATRFGLNAEEVLDNIAIARVYNHEAQMELVRHIAERIASDDAPTRLIIIDSATALFRVDFSGRGELAERQQRLGQYMSGLKKLAEEYNVAVLITNQVMATPDAMAMGPTVKPIGGHVLAHAATTRLYLRKGRLNQRIAKVVDSPYLGENEAVFALAEEGIVDAE